MAFRHNPALHRTFFLRYRFNGLSLKAYLDRIADMLNRDRSATRIAL